MHLANDGHGLVDRDLLGAQPAAEGDGLDAGSRRQIQKRREVGGIEVAGDLEGARVGALDEVDFMTASDDPRAPWR